MCAPRSHTFYRISYFAACSYFRVIEHWSHTSAGPKYWMGPGYTNSVLMAQLSRCSANLVNAAPSRVTRAFWITGFIAPWRRSMFIIMVIGIPPAIHCTEGLVRLRTLDIYPVTPARMRHEALNPRA